MGSFLFPRASTDIFLECFYLLCAQTRAHWAMPALWRTGLLLSFITYSSCLENECVLGIVGQPISLPCYIKGDPENFLNFFIEWRRDDEVVLRSVWGQTGHVEMWSISDTNSTKVSTDALQTGNFSLEFSSVDPKEDKTYYSLFIVSGENESTPVCHVCLRTAASFSYPLLVREDPEEGHETVFMCHSSGGFPEPAVSWLIDETEEPPRESVQTLVASLPDSSLYNITSHLTINISQDTSVSCIIENQPMNETLISTSYVVHVSPVVSRATEAMWIFSTALCVVVGLMVLAALVYQIHLDRTQKKHYRPDKGHNASSVNTEETVVMNLEPARPATETNV